MATIRYCTPQKVAEFFNFSQKGLTNFTSATTPTSATVAMYVRQSEDEIDSITNDSWRETRIVDYEYPQSNQIRYSQTGVEFSLLHKNILALDATKNDVFEVWDGSSYIDWLSSKTEGRTNDYWINYQEGKVYLVSEYWLRPFKARLKYRYNSGASTTLSATITSVSTTFTVASPDKFPYSGVARIEEEDFYYGSLSTSSMTSIERGINGTTAEAHTTSTNIFYVPEDIQRAAILLTYAKVLENQDRNIIIPVNPDSSNISVQFRYQELRKQAMAILARHQRHADIIDNYDVHLTRW